ncbi:MAG: tRNA uridine(34) 5-carboxymethylaminomethyl modification radical SAM/GNAT enzyme Elp3 [Acidobacteria bacterium]|nr:tRNA uridine(34) 5-carboxymethylaminomethyl modification radical SAM/GNAT enzyme Elp3 [Acidobacteriota bacterium]
MTRSRYAFDPARHEVVLRELICAIEGRETLPRADLEELLRRHPKEGRGFFSKAEIIQGFRHLRAGRLSPGAERIFLDKIRMKPVRTQSGVTPVTVLTKPFPCPGQCIFCPSDVRMPKSYLSDEPGAQRAAQHQFDPYLQTLSRLTTYHNTGHPCDKVELIILGGTWSSYADEYQIWFVQRCFEALNAFGRIRQGWRPQAASPRVDFRHLTQRVDGLSMTSRYNEIVTRFAGEDDDAESSTWLDLEQVQRENENAAARCVGLVVETRPDNVAPNEIERLRRLGTTKVQIGVQSLSDRVLELNHRGHDVATTRRAFRLLRLAGFKIHAHWMPNLYGSDPAADIEDFQRLFDDRDFRPDELKIYPCSLIESAELMAYHADGRWRPYDHDELLEVVTTCLLATPEYCRVTRVIRDIPGTDIVTGNKLTNFRQIAEKALAAGNRRPRDIRSREIGQDPVAREDLELRESTFESSIGREIFLQYVTEDDRLAAFLRLALPDSPATIEEIDGSAMIREVHTYGRLVAFGERPQGRSQHLGLGRSLIAHATDRAAAAGYPDLAVISSVGTRQYYRRLGFADGPLYQHLPLPLATR